MRSGSYILISRGLGSVAARGSSGMRRWLGVLEFLYVSPARVLIGCLVSLAAIFAVDIFTPRSDYFAILYIVPAATAAAVLFVRQTAPSLSRARLSHPGVSATGAEMSMTSAASGPVAIFSM